MLKKITFLTEIFTIFLCMITILSAIELKIIPLKKPQLDTEIKEKKITQNILKPKKKTKYQN